ncbi:RcnB family protein [Sphingomonas sp.]|uniref:RcnB family protein n=1 Tax=Sphingomonas sp. TaxID=28214 RepID=UPI001B0818F8|nr:RcnB family protein [Sphingomonas sp.]MBO9715016.1 RcnB family protein [Sphingomonas sp.]
MPTRFLTGLAAVLASTATLGMAVPAQAQDHHWRKGERFDRRHASHYVEIDYHHNRHLKAPPRGYHWVRSGNDAVLVAISTGIIASVVANAMR